MTDGIQHSLEQVPRLAGDVVSYGVVAATITSLLPPIAAFMSIIWIGYQLWHAEADRRNNKKDKDV